MLGRTSALVLFAVAVPAHPQALLRGLVETLEDDERRPVAEAAVRAFVRGEAVAVAWSDREGRYALEVPAETFELSVRRPGYVVTRAGGLALPRVQRFCAGDCGEVDFLLARSAAFEVWISDPSGDPFPRVRIRLSGAGSHVAISREERTDDRGAVRFHGLAAGRYRLDFHPGPSDSPQGPLYEIDAAEVELRPGENAPLHRSARRAGADTFSLSAVIEGVDFDNSPYTLIIRSLGGPPEDAYSMLQLSSQLTIPRLPRGEYVLELRPMGASVAARTRFLGQVRLDENRSGVVLRAPSHRRSWATSASRRTPETVDLALRSDEGWTWRSIRVERRFPHFEVRDAPPGIYALVAEREDFFLVEAPSFQLAEGSGRAVEVVVSARFGSVRGRVRDVQSSAARIELEGPGGTVVAAPARDGAFAFEQLAPGAYALCVAAGGAPCAPERVRRFAIEPGDEIEIELGRRNEGGLAGADSGRRGHGAATNRRGLRARRRRSRRSAGPRRGSARDARPRRSRAWLDGPGWPILDRGRAARALRPGCDEARLLKGDAPIDIRAGETTRRRDRARIPSGVRRPCRRLGRPARRGSASRSSVGVAD
ncbi:MAG: carboxypeptidase-like regulatory domain-containing protein [Bryobacterales bacterium]